MEFTEELFKELKIKYNKAVKNGEKDFIFYDNTLLVAYAKYLLEYLEPKFKKDR